MCRKKFAYYKFENLLFGYKEDSPICVECYYKGIDRLVEFGKELKDRPLFYGSLSDKQSRQKEIKKYYEVIDVAKFAEHILNENVAAWCDTMQ